MNEQRAPYVAIAAGVVCFTAFNTVLCQVDVWYFGFILVVLALCVPFLFTAPKIRWSINEKRALGAAVGRELDLAHDAVDVDYR